VSAAATFTGHNIEVGGRAEYFLTGPKGEKWTGSWSSLRLNPISLFEAHDGEDKAKDENMRSSMKLAFEPRHRIAHDLHHAVSNR
jgi:hypothetical protein